MEPFTRLEAVAAPLDIANVDTDRIIPARFLRLPRSAGYHNYLFHDLREAGGFVLDDPAYRSAKILVAAENFGCGSSREGAVWALAGAGLRAWIAPSFGDIFFENSFKNGVLPVILPALRVRQIRQLLAARPGSKLVIDLAAQTVALPEGSLEHFEVDPFRKECLLKGWDEIDLTLQHEAAIAAYEARQRNETPWLAKP
ncbi:MAG: 3-isopropylmalate dehydratase small subunit [Betaproteobacteria bacterium]|nr:3-isopropylmalate dehydratase small subunit [Betaproteobacteria bacterium]MBM3384615.1 3-isopropylmalate dehydratase small subunit [Betaproteobacteria bacterium]